MEIIEGDWIKKMQAEVNLFPFSNLLLGRSQQLRLDQIFLDLSVSHFSAPSGMEWDDLKWQSWFTCCWHMLEHFSMTVLDAVSRGKSRIRCWQMQCSQSSKCCILEYYVPNPRNILSLGILLALLCKIREKGNSSAVELWAKCVLTTLPDIHSALWFL